MEVKSVNSFPLDVIEQLISPIAFYKDVKLADPRQYELLMFNSHIVYCKPGEVVIRKGERDSWLYFLLKGQLGVYQDNYREAIEPVNVITPGEVFGDLAMLATSERTATLVADKNSKTTVLFGTNFSAFAPITDYSRLTLDTKLRFLRNTIHTLRWKLDVYSFKYPQSDLAGQHRSVKVFLGAKETEEELLALRDQGIALANYLRRWNSVVDATFGEKAPVSQQAMNVVGAASSFG